MRVALIAPPFQGSARGLPLGLAQLASMLELNGFEVHAIDLTICDDSNVALAAFLDRTMPQIVGISTVCATYLGAVQTAEACRAALGSSAKIIGGGPHVTFGSDVIMSRRDCFDICVLGEAEYTFLELCIALDRADETAWKSVPGIAFRDGSLIRTSTPRALAPNLDELPLPSRSHFPQIGYEQGYLDALGVLESIPGQKAEMIASRGCPYPCGFCSTKEFWQRSYRTRSPSNVADELEQLRDSGHTDIYFNDDIFTVRREWVIGVCEQIILRDLRIRWACGTRVDRVDKELLTLMKAAGCVYIYYGVESGSDIINKHQQKNSSVAKIEEAYALLHEVGIYSSAALIFGLPGETWETARATVDWIRDVVRPDEVWISKASCYPGTALARQFNVDASDYEFREHGRSIRGMLYGTGGIQTPFFNDINLVSKIWDYAKSELAELSVAFGDDFGLPVVPPELFGMSGVVQGSVNLNRSFS